MLSLVFSFFLVATRLLHQTNATKLGALVCTHTRGARVVVYLFIFKLTTCRG